MIIDFHTHCFPDKLAARTMESLAKVAGTQPVTDGTAAGLLKKLDEDGIDKAVVLHIATKPKNQTSVNNFAAALQAQTDRLYCFGSVHPDAPDAVDELHRIKELGLKGIKLHPDYQGFFVEDPKAEPIYSALEELGLPVTFHMGYDPYSPEVMHAAPEEVARIAKKHPRLTVIAAHMGGLCVGERVLLHLCGLENVYLDTAMCAPAPYGNRDLYQRILDAHGETRILFGSDCPWDTPASERAWLGAAATDGILAGNAERVLCL